jgi:HK97 family phage major capsid protein
MAGVEEIQAEISSLTTEIQGFRKNSVALPAWEEFKAENDKRLGLLEKKPSVDPVLEEKVNKIAELVAREQERFDQFNATLTRLNMQVTHETTPDLREHARQFFQTKSSRHNPSLVLAPEHIDIQAYTDYKTNWNRYVRKGEQILGPDEFKALSVGSDPDGGYLAPPDLTGRTITRIFETSPLRQLASVQSISTQQLEGLVDKDDIIGSWVGETAARPQTATPKWAKWIISPFEQYANPAATQTLLDDAQIDVEAWLQRKLADKFARDEAAAFILGQGPTLPGTTMPRGITTYPATSATGWNAIAQIHSGNATQLTSDGIISLTFALKEPYYANANYLMNRTTVATVMKLKTGAGDYLWHQGLSEGQPSTMLGYPVRFAADMPDVTEVAPGLKLPIAFGDFREGYQIVDRIGIRILRDPYTAKPFVLFYSTRRVGGDVVNFDAFALQVIAV